METNDNKNLKEDTILLRLYILGMTVTAQKAIANLEAICEETFPGKYSIEVVDLKKDPELASREQIFAVPTVVRKLPLPIRKVIGDLSDTEKVLVGLELSSNRQRNNL
jgi:circadian clock protein KaiB